MGKRKHRSRSNERRQSKVSNYDRQPKKLQKDIDIDRLRYDETSSSRDIRHSRSRSRNSSHGSVSVRSLRDSSDISRSSRELTRSRSLSRVCSPRGTTNSTNVRSSRSATLAQVRSPRGATAPIVTHPRSESPQGIGFAPEQNVEVNFEPVLSDHMLEFFGHIV